MWRLARNWVCGAGAQCVCQGDGDIRMYVTKTQTRTQPACDNKESAFQTLRAAKGVRAELDLYIFIL